MVRPQVHSNKHYVQNSLATVTASTKRDDILVSAVNVTAANLVNEVVEGSTIKAVYFEQWLRSSEVSPGSFIFAIYKLTGGSTVFSTAELAAMGSASNKKNVLFFSQGLVNDADSVATPVLKGWVKIPKSKQRFGLGDSLIMATFAQGAIDLQSCGFVTYKEYS